jgi:hypothetical protein
MTTGITAAWNPAQYVPATATDSKARPEAAAPAESMAPTTLSVLVNAITAEMVRADGGTGLQGRDTPVDLRPPGITLGQAAETLTSIIGKLPVVLGALLGSQDALQHEAGAEQKASEGAASALPLRAADTLARPDIREAVTGVDADVEARSANAGGWLSSSPFSHLLTLLRQLLLKFEAMERKNGAAMVIMQREATIAAGDRGVEKAKESLTGAISSTLVVGAVGAAATHQTFKSTEMVKNSNIKNMNAGNASNVAVHDDRAFLKSATTPTAELRPARGLDGSNVPAGAGSSRPDAALQADVDADIKAMRASGMDQVGAPENEALQSLHASSSAHAQIPASHAMLLNMLAPAVGGTVTAGVNIEAEMTEAERQLLLNVAETLKRVADGHQDQQMKTREMREATSQLVESLLNLAASTSGHIIGKY